MATEKNPELRRAWDFVEHTGTSIFLTGKAGTGKTTFLRTIVEKSAKQMIVVAPTGVAAINAGGVTIHSFFQLDLAPHIPGSKVNESNIQRFHLSQGEATLIGDCYRRQTSAKSQKERTRAKREKAEREKAKGREGKDLRDKL